MKILCIPIFFNLFPILITTVGTDYYLKYIALLSSSIYYSVVKEIYTSLSLLFIKAMELLYSIFFQIIFYDIFPHIPRFKS